MSKLALNIITISLTILSIILLIIPPHSLVIDIFSAVLVGYNLFNLYIINFHKSDEEE